MGMHVLNLQHRCHSSYAQKDAPGAITSSSGDAAGDSVKIPTLGQQCCRFMPLTLPSMRPRLKARRMGSKEQAQEAEWINRVVKDPMVEIDPATMAQHLLARKYYALVAPSEAAPEIESNSPSPVMETISTSPFSHFAMAPRGLGSVMLALGAAIALASLAAAVHLFRTARHQQVAEQHEPQPLTYASSDEELQGKLDLLSIVQQEEPAQVKVAQQGPKLINQGGAISLKPEVVIAVAAAAAAAAAAVETMKQLNISTSEQEKPAQYIKPEVIAAAAAAAASAAAAETMKQLNISTENPTEGVIAAAADQLNISTSEQEKPAEGVIAAAAETMKQLNISTAEQEKPTQYIKPEVVIFAAAHLVQQAVAAAQVISKVDLEEPPETITPKPEVVKAPAAEVQAAAAPPPPPPPIISPKPEVVKAPAAEVQAAAAAPPPPPPIISPKPEAVKAPAAEVQAAAAPTISPKPEVVKAPAAEVQAAAPPPPPPIISPKPEVVKAPAAEVQAAAAPPPPPPQVEAPQIIPKPEVVKAAAETIEVQEAVAAAQVIGKVEQKEQPGGNPEFGMAAAAQAIELEKSVEAEIGDEGHVNKVVVTDVVVNKRIAITGGAQAAQEVHSMATSNKRQEHTSSAVNPVPLPPSLLDSTPAPEDLSSNNNMDRRSVPLDHSKNLSDHFFKNSYLTFPSLNTNNFMRDISSSRTGDARKEDETTSSSSSSDEEDETISNEERSESLKKVVQAAAPAMALGAGAMSVLTGVDGAFEMVGLAATASFISFELIWADAREELWGEVKKISDHNKLLEFFKARKIIQSDDI